MEIRAAGAALNGARYRAVATNRAGSATSNPATLSVMSAPTFTLNPVSQTVAAGENLSFTVAARGVPAPSFYWEYSVDGGASWSTVPDIAYYSGASTSALTLTGTFKALNGLRYRAVAMNMVGSAVSAAATLSVTAVVITTHPASRVVTAGQNVSFTVAAIGAPSPVYRWQISTSGGTV